MAFGSAPHLFCFGLGYTAKRLAWRLLREGWIVSGTCRDPARCRELGAAGIRTYLFDRDRPLVEPAAALATVTDILSSVPPDETGDPVLDCHGEAIARHRSLRWVGYLSTTGVYGNTDGTIVDETAPLRPTTSRSERRMKAEQAWLTLYSRGQLPVHIFRLAGIYGPGRSAIERVLAGEAKRIERTDHLFSRIHVDDIATVLRTSMARHDPGRIYNVCDDEPAAPADAVAFACTLLGRPPPPLIPFADAEPQMTPMARSFWQDNRRVDNGRMKRELGVTLKYPDYRTGLTAIAAELQGAVNGGRTL
jgi:nucleoside-diphosphate-sugar epimerase